MVSLCLVPVEKFEPRVGVRDTEGEPWCVTLCGVRWMVEPRTSYDPPGGSPRLFKSFEPY